MLWRLPWCGRASTLSGCASSRHRPGSPGPARSPAPPYRSEKGSAFRRSKGSLLRRCCSRVCSARIIEWQLDGERSESPLKHGHRRSAGFAEVPLRERPAGRFQFRRGSLRFELLLVVADGRSSNQKASAESVDPNERFEDLAALRDGEPSEFLCGSGPAIRFIAVKRRTMNQKSANVELPQHNARTIDVVRIWVGDQHEVSAVRAVVVVEMGDEGLRRRPRSPCR